MAKNNLQKWIVGLSGVAIFTGLIGYTQHVDNNIALAKSLSTPNTQTKDIGALQGPKILPTTLNDSVNEPGTDVKTNASSSNVTQSSSVSSSESQSSVKKSTQISTSNESHSSVKKPTQSSSSTTTESIQTQPTNQVPKQVQTSSQIAESPVVTHQRIRTRAS